MPAWLDRWLSRPPAAPAAPTLADRLRSYPPYIAPHPGWGLELTQAQARENLAHFLASREQRLALVGDLLRADAGLDVGAALAAPVAQAPNFTAALHAWALERWPPLRDPRLVRHAAWLASTRQGDEIVFSMLLDVATVLGEMVVRNAPDWRWDVNLDSTDLNDGMASARRVVLLADPVGSAPAPFTLDIEGTVVNNFQSGSPWIAQRLNEWGRCVTETVAGAYQAVYRAEVARRTAGPP